jgi:hypothetical protein
MWQSDCESLPTSPLFTCWWISFEVVLGNKEFEFVHGCMTVVLQGYLCKFCELFCGHSSSSQEFVTVGINLGTVWSLFYYWTSKLINILPFPSFPFLWGDCFSVTMGANLQNVINKNSFIDATFAWREEILLDSQWFENVQLQCLNIIIQWFSYSFVSGARVPYNREN